MILDGERQVAPTRDGIRRDHVARYEWAAARIGSPARIVDLACGIGYGSEILAEAGHRVTGIDQSAEAIGYGEHFYGHPSVRRIAARAEEVELESDGADVAVCFETIEHVAEPAVLLRELHRACRTLYASVPNETVIPFGSGFAHHHRHYTRDEFASLLDDCGWSVREWWGQDGPESEVERDADGRTLIAVCDRKTEETPVLQRDTAVQIEGWTPRTIDDYELGVPDHVAILGLGPSLEQYVDVTKRMGGKHAFADEVWGINAVAGVLMCDRVFHMDDVRIQEARAKAAPESNIARMLEWLRVHPGPVITSRAHEDYVGLVEFPLEEVLNTFRVAYFNSTAAYAIAYAVWLGVRKISIFGMDFTYANSHQAEQGRACVEYWLGIAASRGIKVSVAKSSSLLDACEPMAQKFYGFDTLDLTLREVDGRTVVDRVPRSVIPTADEIEARYDHSQHVNPLVRGAS